MSSNRSILLGLFFLATLSVLAYYTLFLTDFALFKERPELRVQFSQANGLREGDTVLVAGMRWGRVKHMSFDPKAPIEKRVLVLASLNEPLPLRAGYTIQIKDATLLGGRNLWIDPGPAEGAPVSTADILPGTVSPNPIDAISKLLDQSGKGVGEIVENLRVVSVDLRSGKGLIGRLIQDQTMADDLAASLSSLSKSLTTVELIVKDLGAGRGSAGQLLVNDSLYREVEEAARKLSGVLEETNGLAKDLRNGNGLAGRLISDPSLGHDLSEAIAAFRSVAAKIDAGQGTLGVLVNDDGIARDVESVTKSLASGEGTIGSLLYKPDVYDNVRQISEDVAVVSGALRGGQGSIGRLVMDDDLYQDLKTAVRIVQRSLEEFREAAPITTFTTVFFGAF